MTLHYLHVKCIRLNHIFWTFLSCEKSTSLNLVSLDISSTTSIIYDVLFVTITYYYDVLLLLRCTIPFILVYIIIWLQFFNNLLIYWVTNWYTLKILQWINSSLSNFLASMTWISVFCFSLNMYVKLPAPSTALYLSFLVTFLLLYCIRCYSANVSPNFVTCYLYYTISILL